MLGETKLVPPRKGKNANYLSIKHVYLRVARGDFLERMGQQFLNYAGGAPKLYINRLGLLPDTHDTRIPNTNTYLVVSAPDGNCPENAAFHAKERICRLSFRTVRRGDSKVAR